jgi:hypothetical protein
MSEKVASADKMKCGLTSEQVVKLLHTDPELVACRVADLMARQIVPASLALIFYSAYCQAKREQSQESRL